MAAGAPFLGVARSVTGRSWRARSSDERLASALSQRLALPDVVARVLAGRGVELDEADAYLDPSLRTWLPDPSQLPDMDVAATRLAHAIQAGEKIAVFGDYDVDGATSSSLLKRYFKSIGCDIAVYIPDRVTEGYGPNIPALERLKTEGAALVVTVDCGTLSHGPLRAAQLIGLEVIVVDHHLAEPALPPALAVINPNRVDIHAPLAQRQLAAVGVTFLLVVAVNRALRNQGYFRDRAEPDLRQWLDLVALGTVCDVVPLQGINRALVAQGLKIMAGRSNPGLAALADIASLKEPPTAYHAGFLLGPRVNAGGRVGRADLGTRLLSTDDPAEAVILAAELHRLNAERQKIEAQVLHEAQAQVERGRPFGPLVVAAGEGWHVGVIGIVASRLKDLTNRPTFVVALNGALGKGSGRSIAGVDLGAAVTAARQAGLLIDGGGHSMAAGLTVATARLGELTDFLAGRLRDSVAGVDDVASLGFDGALSASGATPDLLELLRRAGPYGAGNAEPRFVIASARLVQADLVGENDAGEGHVRCVLVGEGGARLKGIAFRCLKNGLGRTLLQARADGTHWHLAGHLRADNWRGEGGVQLVIEDAAPA